MFIYNTVEAKHARFSNGWEQNTIRKPDKVYYSKFGH